jgi:hypothetical protein
MWLRRGLRCFVDGTEVLYVGLRWARDAAAMECVAASLCDAVMRRDAALVVLDCKVPARHFSRQLGSLDFEAKPLAFASRGLK